MHLILEIWLYILWLALFLFPAAPLLIEPPIPTSVVKGDLFKLTCLVDGDPFPSVSWYHDDQLVIAGGTTTFGWVIHGVLYHRQLHWLFSSVFRLSTKKPSKFQISSLLWRETPSHQWIPLSKGHCYGKRFHVMTSSLDDSLLGQLFMSLSNIGNMIIWLKFE